MYVIDRTKNPQGKSIPNVKRFHDKAKDEIRKSVSRHIAKKKISDSADGSGNKIVITGNGLHEARLYIDHDISNWVKVLPGNPRTEDHASFLKGSIPFKRPTSFIRQTTTNFEVGDEIYKPPSGNGSGKEGSNFGDGEDEFLFSLNEEEWTKFLFDQLNLPNQKLTKSVMKALTTKRAGLTTSGPPANLHLLRTARNAAGRRFGLGRPKSDDVEALEKKIAEEKDDAERGILEIQLDAMKSRMEFIPWLDPLDVRYVAHTKEYQLKFNAVMFCLMDVSASMSEHMKKLAKYFYVFLYKFLKFKYGHVEVVFIRHTHLAKEVDEDTFFYSKETGGTVVSTALEEMKKIVSERYDTKLWNIYCAQVSDGDNSWGDNNKVIKLLQEAILPNTQYYTYIEVARSEIYDWGSRDDSTLWGDYKNLASIADNFVMDKITKVEDLWPIMVRLFGEK